jgi:iron complex transport system substrate-binding protein
MTRSGIMGVVANRARTGREGGVERQLTRRELLAAGLAIGATLMPGCGSSGSESAAWTFVDDRKHTVRLNKRPTRIAAYSTSAAALHQWGVTPVGVFGEDPPDDPWLAGFPWTDSEVVGSVYGEIDTAKLLALRTQLIVTQWFPQGRTSPLFGFKDLPQQHSIAEKVPIVALRANLTATAQIAHFAALVRALGVDTSGGRIARAREAFQRAAEHLSQVARRRSKLRIIAVSGDQSTMYVSTVVNSADLVFFRHRGVPIVSAQSSDTYWDSFSWNHADKYPADGILYDARPGVLPLAAAMKIPGFAALPAVRASQIGTWRTNPPASYPAYTQTMNELAATIASWRRVT